MSNFRYFDIHLQYDRNHGESFYVKFDENDVPIDEHRVESYVVSLAAEKYGEFNEEYVDDIYEMTEDEWLEYFEDGLTDPYRVDKIVEGIEFYCLKCKYTFDGKVGEHLDCPECKALNSSVTENPYMTCICGARVYLTDGKNDCSGCDRAYDDEGELIFEQDTTFSDCNFCINNFEATLQNCWDESYSIGEVINLAVSYIEAEIKQGTLIVRRAKL